MYRDLAELAIGIDLTALSGLSSAESTAGSNTDGHCANPRVTYNLAAFALSSTLILLCGPMGEATLLAVYLLAWKDFRWA